MKKSYITILLLVMFLLSLPLLSHAQNDDSLYEAYGLCVSFEVMEFDSNFNMNNHVNTEDYNKILKFWFDGDYSIKKSPTKSDFIYDLSAYVSDMKKTDKEITSFKDFGFIKKEHRNAYKKVFSHGFLDFEDDYLEPNYPLTYRYMFKLLINFDNEFKYANKLDLTIGTITDVYSRGKNIVIKQSGDRKMIEYKFNRNHSFLVQSESIISDYSYNIERGNNTKIYSRDGEIIFISIINKNNNLKNSLVIEKSTLFLCNTYENEIIFLNDDGSYFSYGFPDNILIYDQSTELTLDKLNSDYIDAECYYIIDKSTNTLKYINLTRR